MLPYRPPKIESKIKIDQHDFFPPPIYPAVSLTDNGAVLTNDSSGIRYIVLAYFDYSFTAYFYCHAVSLLLHNVTVKTDNEVNGDTSLKG